MAEYRSVDVEHPHIAAAIRRMIVRGFGTETIVRLVGMPHEVVQRYRREPRTRRLARLRDQAQP